MKGVSNMHNEHPCEIAVFLLTLRASLFLTLALVSLPGFATEFEVEGDAIYEIGRAHV